MSHLSPRHHSCGVSSPFLVVLIAVLMAGDHQLFLGTANAQRPSPDRPQRSKLGAGPMDGNPLLFYLAGTYLAGGSTGDGSVTVADGNGDGKPDLVVTNGWECSGCGDGGVSVLLGNGDGTFQPAVTYSSGGIGPASVAVAELNGDGKPDLIVVNCGPAGYSSCGDRDGLVGVLLGNGDGTFQPPVIYDAGPPYVRSLSVADVNGDGRRDIVVTNGAGAGVLLGNGDGTFRAAVNYGPGAAGLAVADVSGDGHPDIVETWSGEVGVLLGKGDGTFQSAVSYSSGGYEPLSVAIADVNGDGHPDLVVTNYCQVIECNDDGVVSVLLGNGDGTFRATVTYDSGACCTSFVSLADVNGDGYLDIAVSSVGVEVLLGNGDGTFQKAVGYASGGYSNLDGSIAFADVNGDGKPDLLVANGQSNTIGVLLNNSGAPLTTTTLTSSHNPVPAGRKNTVTYTASIAAQAGGAVTGNVIFRDGGFAIATVPVANRQATYSTAYTYGGAHPMTAIYSGDANNAGSISATLTEYVESVTTRTLITTSGSPSLVGQPVTFTATVTAKHGTVPDGEMVTFYDDAAAMASVSLANGKATYTTSSLSTNTRSVKASYPGDTTLEPSSKSVPQTVLKYSTTTSLTSTPNPSLHGKPVSFTATVAPSGPHAPIGRVKFWDGTTSIGMASLKSGMATLNKSTLGVGTHAITAQYLSDAYNDKSTSAIVEQVVQ